MQLKTVHCPRCGAEVTLDVKRQQATCKFCGTVSYTESATNTGPTLVVKAHPSLLVAVGLGLLAVVVVALSFAGGKEPPVAAVPALPVEAPKPAVIPPPPPKPALVPVLHVQSHTPVRLVDTDGDQQDELLLPVEQTLAGSRTQHFAVFALPGGKLLHQTAAIDPRALNAVIHNRLVLAESSGQLQGFDLASGDRQWTTALGERVAALCEAEGDALHVATDDDRNLLVDVKTGRQSEVHTPCKVPLAVANGRHAPSDRRDYRAPSEIAAFTCGGVRVMGSDNYSVPDACRARAKLDTDHLEGMVGHAVWKFAGGWLVFGVRKPGTYVPMVGLYERAKWTWKSEVPVANPLEAQEGGPRWLSLRGDSLVVGYESARKHYLTRLDARTGMRSWTVEVPSLVAIAQNEQLVVAHGADSARVLSLRDGSLLTTL